MMETDRPRISQLWLIGLTILGIIFRFAEMGSVRISHDLAWQGWEAARIVSGVYPLIGQPSSVFLDNPPLMGYLQAIPLFFFDTPWSIFIFVTGLNALAVPILFVTLEKPLGLRVAIFATLLFAINPWIVHFSRMTWTQGLLPFFLCVMLWGWLSTFLGVPKQNSFSWPFLLGWIAFTAMLQTYILAFAMLAPVGLIMLIFWRKLPKRELAIGCAILVLSLGFYGWSVNRNLDQNSNKFFDFLSDLGGGEAVAETDESSNQVLNLTDDSFVHAMRLITGRDFVGQDINGPTPLGPIPVPIVSQLARWLFSLVFIGGFIWLILQRSSLTILLTVWFFVPILMMMVLPTSVFVHPHYLLFTLPAGSIIAALGIDWFVRQHNQAIWAAAFLLLIISVQFKASLWQSGRTVFAQEFEMGFEGLPLRTAAGIGQEIAAYTPEQIPLRVVAPINDQIATSISGRWVDVVEGANQPGLMMAQSAIDTPFLKLTDGDGNVHAVASAESVKSLIENPAEIPSEAGVTYLGNSYSQDGGALLISTFWRIDVLHDARNEWFITPFIHLIDDEGQTVVNQAPHPIWGYQWRMGDVYVSTVELESPVSLEKVGAGLFDPISSRTFLLDVAGAKIPRYEFELTE